MAVVAVTAAVAVAVAEAVMAMAVTAVMAAVAVATAVVMAEAAAVVTTCTGDDGRDGEVAAAAETEKVGAAMAGIAYAVVIVPAACDDGR